MDRELGDAEILAARSRRATTWGYDEPITPYCLILFSTDMLLIGSGSGFVKALDKAGALALSVPPEGGSEGHYLRRLRGAGYEVVRMTARGLGDLSSYLTRVHGVRPPHVGKSDRRTYYFPPLVEQYAKTLPPKSKGLVFWLIEGHVFSQAELTYLTRLAATDARVRFVVEVESDRKLRWKPLTESAA